MVEYLHTLHVYVRENAAGTTGPEDAVAVGAKDAVVLAAEDAAAVDTARVDAEIDS